MKPDSAQPSQDMVMGWGSDVVAEILRRLEIKYVCVNPGSSLRDGEFLGSASALRTAAHYQIPVLIVVGNNRSYFADEIEQELVAKQRKRRPENRWIGQRIDDPPVDLAGLARHCGIAAEDPIEEASDLLPALERGIKAVESGEPYLVDVLIDRTRGAAFDWLSGA